MLPEKFLSLLFAVDTSKEFLYLNLTLQLHKPIEESFRTRRTSRDIDVDRNYLVNA